MVTKDFKTYVY